MPPWGSLDPDRNHQILRILGISSAPRLSAPQGTPIPTPHIPTLTPKSTHSTSTRRILPFLGVKDKEGVPTLFFPS